MNHGEIVSFLWGVADLIRTPKLKGKIEDLDAQLRRASGYAFYNTSRYDFEKLLADAPHLAANLRNYIAGFSPNMREVLRTGSPILPSLA